NPWLRCWSGGVTVSCLTLSSFDSARRSADNRERSSREFTGACMHRGPGRRVSRGRGVFVSGMAVAELVRTPDRDDRSLAPGECTMLSPIDSRHSPRPVIGEFYCSICQKKVACFQGEAIQRVLRRIWPKCCNRWMRFDHLARLHPDTHHHASLA